MYTIQTQTDQTFLKGSVRRALQDLTKRTLTFDYLNTVLAAVIFWQNFFFDFNHFFDINALLIWVFMRHKSHGHGKCYVSNILQGLWHYVEKNIQHKIIWYFNLFSIFSLLGKNKSEQIIVYTLNKASLVLWKITVPFFPKWALFLVFYNCSG